MFEAMRERWTLDGKDARDLVEYTFEAHPARHFAVRLWTGEQIQWGAEPHFTIAFTDAETFRRCFLTQDPAEFAEAYVDGRMIIEGDIWEAAGLASYLRSLHVPFRDKLRFAPKLVVPFSPHTVERDGKDVRAHYDLSNDFFGLFLDEKLVYSCAYFAHPTQSLERAQERKLDLICRKLALAPGEAFLDVGCGWGALLIWAAQHYGVRAHGTTLSENQLAEARRRVAAAGLTDRVTVELQHYSDLPPSAYDKISSVGMYEHVGLGKLPAYLSSVYRTLRPGGLFLNHGITKPRSTPNAGGAFIFRHVFPGAELASVARVQAEMEATGFEIEDVQSLRRHYALTMRRWSRRYQARRERARAFVPERTLRIYDLFLAGCAHGFADGVIGVHQVLAGKLDAHGSTRAPLTRQNLPEDQMPYSLLRDSRPELRS